MPFRSKAQMRFLFKEHPQLARRWAAKYGVSKRLPEHVKGSPSHERELASRMRHG